MKDRLTHLFRNQRRPTRHAPVLNIALRGMTLGTRFVFILLMAKLLAPADVGRFGLFTATVGYAGIAAGLEFFNFATREILHAPPGAQGGMIKAQAVLLGLVQIALAPLLVVALTLVGWSPLLLWWVVPIMVLEQFNQETTRLLNAYSQQVSASILQFLRQASWALALIVLMALVPDSRQLSVVLPAWAVAGVVAAIFGYRRLSQLGIGGWHLALDWAWIGRGIKVSSGFLLAMLAVRATQTLDRYWLEAIADLETLAAYVLFVTIAAAMIQFLDAGVLAFAYPRLIAMHRDKQPQQAAALLRKVLLQTITFCVVFGGALWLLLPYLIAWIGNPAYAAGMGLFVWVLFAMALNGIGLVFHYGLYTRGADRPIILSHLAGLATFVVATWALTNPLGATAVPVGLALSFLTVLIGKATAYLRITHTTAQADAG